MLTCLQWIVLYFISLFLYLDGDVIINVIHSVRLVHSMKHMHTEPQCVVCDLKATQIHLLGPVYA